jgi:hypothetical protein
MRLRRAGLLYDYVLPSETMVSSESRAESLKLMKTSTSHQRIDVRLFVYATDSGVHSRLLNFNPATRIAIGRWPQR